MTSLRNGGGINVFRDSATCPADKVISEKHTTRIQNETEACSGYRTYSKVVVRSVKKTKAHVIIGFLCKQVIELLASEYERRLRTSRLLFLLFGLCLFRRCGFSSGDSSNGEGLGIRQDLLDL